VGQLFGPSTIVKAKAASALCNLAAPSRPQHPLRGAEANRLVLLAPPPLISAAMLMVNEGAVMPLVQQCKSACAYDPSTMHSTIHSTMPGVTGHTLPPAAPITEGAQFAVAALRNIARAAECAPHMLEEGVVQATVQMLLATSGPEGGWGRRDDRRNDTAAADNSTAEGVAAATGVVSFDDAATAARLSVHRDVSGLLADLARHGITPPPRTITNYRTTITSYQRVSCYQTASSNSGSRPRRQ
jgi:hypothetical protein